MQSGSQPNKFTLEHITIFCRSLAEAICNNAEDKPAAAQLARKISSDYRQSLFSILAESNDKNKKALEYKRKALIQQIQNLNQTIDLKLDSTLISGITHHIANGGIDLPALLDKDEEWDDFLERLNTIFVEMESILSQSNKLPGPVVWGPMSFFEKITPPTKSMYKTLCELNSKYDEENEPDSDTQNQDPIENSDSNFEDDRLRVVSLIEFENGEALFNLKINSKEQTEFFNAAISSRTKIENKTKEDWYFLANCCIRVGLYDPDDEYAWFHYAVECLQKADVRSQFDSAIGFSQINADFQCLLNYIQRTTTYKDDYYLRLLSTMQAHYASFYEDIKKYEAACHIYLYAIANLNEIFDKKDADWRCIVSIYHSLCETQLQFNGDTDKAGEYISKIAEIYNKIGMCPKDYEDMSTAFHNIAVSLNEKREFYSAESSFRLSLTCFSNGQPKEFDSLQYTYQELAKLSAGPLKELFHAASLFFSDDDLPQVKDFYSWMRAVENSAKPETLEDLLTLTELMKAYAHESPDELPGEYVEFLESKSFALFCNHLMELQQDAKNRALLLAQLMEENAELKSQIKPRVETPEKEVSSDQDSNVDSVNQGSGFFSPRR